MTTLQATKPLSERLILRAAAAGMRSRASTSMAPTILTHATVTSVMRSTNRYSTSVP